MRYSTFSSCLIAIVFFKVMGSSSALLGANPQLETDLQLFVTRCTQCHPIEMAYSTEDLLPSEVILLIERMMGLPGSLIQPHEKKRLYQIALFKIYSEQREELKKKLKDLTPEQRKKEIEALKKALDPYK